MGGSRYLLDSNILVWLDLGNDRISPVFLNILEEAEERFLSAATAWELSLKIANGKLHLASSFESFLKVFHLTELPFDPSRPLRPAAGCASAGGGVDSGDWRQEAGGVWSAGFVGVIRGFPPLR